MKVRVRGGYLHEYQKKCYKGGEEIDVPEEYFKARQHLFDVVEKKAEAPVEVKTETVAPAEVIAEAVAKEDVTDRAMPEPELARRTRRKK